MQSIALSGHTSNADVLARVIAIAGLGVAAATLVLTWHLWRRSGPKLSARVDYRTNLDYHTNPATKMIAFTVDVTNIGRMPATVRSVTVTHLMHRWTYSWWLNSWLRLLHRDGAIGTAAHPVEGTFPIELPPTGYLQARASVEADLFPGHRWAQAMVARGDRTATLSPRITVRDPDYVPRWMRKHVADPFKDIDE